MTAKISRHDIVIYKDRSGLDGQWEVQRVREDGTLQICHVESGKIALGVTAGEIDKNLGPGVKKPKPVPHVNTEELKKAAQNNADDTLRLVLTVMDSLATTVKEGGGKGNSLIVLYALLGVAFFLSGVVATLLVLP